MNRNEVERHPGGGANSSTDNYLSDYGSFAGEIAIEAVVNDVDADPGTLGQYVADTDGNPPHGAIYANLIQDIQATNINASQTAAHVQAAADISTHREPAASSTATSQPDIGGYVAEKHTTVWWSGAYRSTVVGQHYAWLLDEAATVKAQIKPTGRLEPTPRAEFDRVNSAAAGGVGLTTTTACLRPSRS